MHRYVVYIYDDWKSFCDHSGHTREFYVNGNSAAVAVNEAEKHVASGEYFRCLMDQYGTRS